MRAVLLRRVGSAPEVGDEEGPGEPGPGEVRVRVEAAGVCYRDVLEAEGHMPRVRVPIVMGHEFTGSVEETGPGVDGLARGDRVAGLAYISCGQCYECVSGNENLCRSKAFLGEEARGVFAESVIVPRRILEKVPAGTPPEGAAIAACVVGTVLRAIRSSGIDGPGVALITGAGGGLGIHAVQVAKALGLGVIAETHSEWKRERILEAGADEVVVGGEFASEVRRLTGGVGVDLVVENVGHATFEQSFRAVKWGGKIAVLGNIGVGSVSIPLGSLILRGVTIYGSINASRRDLHHALRLLSSGRVRPVVASSRPLEDAALVFEEMKRSAGLGRHILRPT